jgi:hypothetical protein
MASNLGSRGKQAGLFDSENLSLLLRASSRFTTSRVSEAFIRKENKGVAGKLKSQAISCAIASCRIAAGNQRNRVRDLETARIFLPSTERRQWTARLFITNYCISS